jgi:hypothetical protein
VRKLFIPLDQCEIHWENVLKWEWCVSSSPRKQQNYCLHKLTCWSIVGNHMKFITATRN